MSSSRKLTKMENINDAVLITNEQLQKILKKLNATEENEEKLRILEEEKLPYLFKSDHLAELLKVTASVRTRINMMLMVGPRLTDPKARMDYFVGLFRFAEEKAQVEEILKARGMTLNSVMFNKGAAEAIRGAGRGGGRNSNGAGRGRGRGSGVSGSSLTHTLSSHSCTELAEEEKKRASMPINSVSVDSFDRTGRVVHGADSVFADLDDLNNQERKFSADTGGESSDDESSPTGGKKNRRGGDSPSQGATDTESASSEDLDTKLSIGHRRSHSMGRSSLDITAGLTSAAAFGTPPSKMSGGMNPLQAAKESSMSESKLKNDKRVTSLRLQTSPHQSLTWGSQANSNREDASKFVQAGIVQAKMSSYSAPPPVPSSPSHTPASKSRGVMSCSEKSKPNRFEEAMQQAKIKVANMFSRSSEMVSLTAGGPPSVSGDLVGKCAAALNMSRDAFLALSAEEPRGKSPTGEDLFSYQELVRRNYVKDYNGLAQSELEKHLDEKEFEKVFDKKPPQFYAQPKWKQLDQKKKALLF